MAELVVPRGRGPQVDVGRVLVVVLFALSMLSAAGRAWVAVSSAVPPHGTAAAPSVRAVAEAGCSVLTAVFCALVVAAYLRRGAASATDRHPAAWIVAPVATGLPLVLPLLPLRPGGTARVLLALALIGVGTTWSVWSVRHLSTCLSVVPQARGLVDGGPYRWVRHPLYLGEIVAVTGFAVRGGHWSHVLVVLALLGLQLYRARREERLLAAEMPGYAEYAARTWRIVPGLFR